MALVVRGGGEAYQTEMAGGGDEECDKKDAGELLLLDTLAKDEGQEDKEVMYTILNGSENIYNKLNEMFNTPDQHGIIITAFVGGDAAEILPQLNHNVTLYCWPKAGGRNPEGVIDLLENGVNIRFVDKLHMKVYWAEGKGAIIGSANLSTNALGGNGLQEVGIYLEKFSKEDINQIIKSLKNVEKDQSKINEILKNLEREHDALTDAVRQPSKKIRDFSYWYRQYCNGYKRDWKLGWFTANLDPIPKSVLIKVKNEYGVDEPYDACNFKDNSIVREDWILLFFINEDTGNVYLNRISWMYVDFCDKVPKDDIGYNKNYPKLAVQVKKDLNRYPPFEISHSFKKAFQQAVKKYGSNKIIESSTLVPSKAFLENLNP